MTLTWDNGSGLTFTRTVSIDENYMFTVTQSVANSGSTPLNLKAYSRVVRVGLPAGFVPTSYVLHEGPIGVLDGLPSIKVCVAYEYRGKRRELAPRGHGRSRQCKRSKKKAVPELTPNCM